MGKLKDEMMRQEEEREAELEFELEQASKKINKENNKSKKSTVPELGNDTTDNSDNVGDFSIILEANEQVGNKTSDYDLFRMFVNKTKTYIEINGKKYLKAEAWLFLAKLKNLVPSTTVVPVYDNYGNVMRVTAVCKLYNKENGEEVSQSAMVADKKEKFLSGLDDFAVFGMAETRAISRAIRNIYGYVAVGAGFESTPSTEM